MDTHNETMDTHNEQLDSELCRAQERHLETEVLLDGGTLFPRLIVDEIGEEHVTFRDADHATITLDSRVIRGVVVHTTAPKWHIDVCRHTNAQLDLRASQGIPAGAS